MKMNNDDWLNNSDSVEDSLKVERLETREAIDTYGEFVERFRNTPLTKIALLMPVVFFPPWYGFWGPEELPW